MDEEGVLLSLTYLHLKQIRKWQGKTKNSCKKKWVKETFKNRETKGIYHNLIEEMALGDREVCIVHVNIIILCSLYYKKQENWLEFEMLLLFSRIQCCSYLVLHWNFYFQLCSPYVLYEKMFFCYLATNYLSSFRFHWELGDCLWPSIEHLRDWKSGRP